LRFVPFANMCCSSTYADSKVESYLGGFIAGPVRAKPKPVDNTQHGGDHVDTWRQSVARVQDQIKFVESNPFHSFHAGKLSTSTWLMTH
jgi:hypothetical protein